MDVGIGPAEIAQGLLDPERLGLEEKPLMGRTPAGGGDGEPDLEGHVESRCAPGELNPAEIVEGITRRRRSAPRYGPGDVWARGSRAWLAGGARSRKDRR